MEVFDCLPLTCLVDDKYLAMHGGISPEINKLNDINKVNRFEEPPYEGLMCDLLWADPVKYDADETDWTENHSRGCSYKFGNLALQKLKERNQFETIVRAH